MTEVRPIRQEEADSFLKLLCEAFDLDFERARAVFYREPMFEIDRKWACFRDGSIESILTTVPLTFGWGKAIGIAGVATRLPSRGQGLGGKLLYEVLEASEAASEGPALLFAKRTELYERVGFRVLDEVIRARVAPSSSAMEGVLEFEQVQELYDDWSLRSPDRLQRDERRWNYWKWNLRVCCPVAKGYVCLEGATLRECLAEEGYSGWQIPPGTEWLGLEGVAEHLCLPIESGAHELYLMGYRFDSPPQLFLTDQF